MNLATASLNGGFGDTVLILYIIGGLTLAGSAALPNMTSGQRAARIVIGLIIVGWAGYVFEFGGWILISWYVALLPFILAIQGIVAAVKGRKGIPEPSGPPLAPGQPAPYPTFGQAAAAPSPVASVPPPAYAAPGQPPYYPPPGQPYPAPGQPQQYAGPPQPQYPAPGQPYPAPPQQPQYAQDPRYQQQYPGQRQPGPQG